MASQDVHSHSPIIIVGAGIFGLSTAIHLAKRGYRDVTIFDKQPYHQSLYSYNYGCDGASSDVNKIIRAAYGAQIEYQNLALEAINHWHTWNAELKEGVSVPPGMDSSDTLFINNGHLAMSDDDKLSVFERATIANMKTVGKEHDQVILTRPEHVEHARSEGFGYAVDPFGRKPGSNYGILDIGAGVVYADKACRFALHKACSLGVKTLFGPSVGQFDRLLVDGSRIEGIQTVDGKQHLADLTIMACGGWTPSLVPELDGLSETTAGSVALFRVPRSSQLWNSLSPDRFPVWTYNMRAGIDGGFYGFPRDNDGVVKVGYRGVKYTNPQVQGDGLIRSVPTTRWSSQPTFDLPMDADRRIKRALKRFIPELLPYQIGTRLCWYTDTFDNHFVIDFLPNKKGLMVVTGGSGHAFKYLPTIGGFVVDRIEGIAKDELKLWKWRQPVTGDVPYNKIMQGLDSKLALAKQAMSVRDSLQAETARL